MDDSRRGMTPVPPLSPWEGPTCSPVTLVVVAGLAGAVGACVSFRLMIDVFQSTGDLLFVGGVGLFVGMWGGMLGGVVTGQITRVIFQKRERRYYQLAGAFVTGALCGAAVVCVFLWFFWLMPPGE